MSKPQRSKSNGGERRAVVWPRGNFLLLTDFLSTMYTKTLRECGGESPRPRASELSLDGNTPPGRQKTRRPSSAVPKYDRRENKENRNDTTTTESDTVDLATELVRWHLHKRRTRIITYAEWLKFARSVAGFSDEFAFAVLSVAQCIGASQVIAGVQPAVDVVADASDSHVSADLGALAITVAVLGCDRRLGADAVANYFRENIYRICRLSLLGNLEFTQKKTADDSTATLRPDTLVPLHSFIDLDALFEATVVEAGAGASVASIVPQPLSRVLEQVLTGKDTEQVRIADVARLLERCIQADVFRLDDLTPAPSLQDGQRATSLPDVNRLVSADGARAATRSVTSTRLAAHRRVTVRGWTHAELLTGAATAGGNFCARDATAGGASAVFHPRALKTAVLLDCGSDGPPDEENSTSIDNERRSSVGPFVLGPVSDCLLARRLRGAVIHAAVGATGRVFVDGAGADLTLFVNGRAAALMTGDCRRVRLAPYNVYYDGLPGELSASGVALASAAENAALRAVQIDSVFRDESSTATSPGWEPLGAESFYIQPTPFPAERRDSTFYSETFVRSIPSSFWSAWTARRDAAERRLAQATRAERERALLARWTRADLCYLWRRVERRINLN